MNAPGRLLSQLPGIYHSSRDLQELLAGLEATLFGMVDPELPKEDMRAVEDALQSKGYEVGAVDGVADDETRAAIRAFQKDNNLSVTGVVDQKTADRLGVTIKDRALERQIARIHTYFDAFLTPEEFLPWLAQWLALSRAAGLPPERQRRLVGRIVPLYAWRGTRRYLTELLEFYLPEQAEVSVEDQEFVGLVVGKARIGLDSWLEHDRPFWFKVTVRMPDSAGAAEQTPLGRKEWQERIRQVIELAKPAHTTYDLELALSEPEN